MRIAFKDDPVSDNNGFILVITLLIMLVLVILGTFALNSTTVELRIAGNDRVIKEDFYDQEACATVGAASSRTWLTDDYLASNPESAHYPPASNSGISKCRNNANIVSASFKIRNIVYGDHPITDWADIAKFAAPAKHPANQIPKMEHVDKPPPADEDTPDTAITGQSGFEIRRYAVTSYSPREGRNAIVQKGLYKVFNAAQ